MNSSFRNMETLLSEMNATLKNLVEEEEFHMLLSYDQEKTLNDVTLISVEDNEHAMEEHLAIDGLAPCVYEYWSEKEELEENEVSIEENFKVSTKKANTSISQVQEEVEKEIEVTFERPKGPQ
ncbi:hypothetical protein Scep_012015 [Stephania cephalantha]|uniref:Uncharacterized protein n=1 Tax=Stephania cephalantha TaxID=152367 RepID=A0AAP0P643_9MAGN